MDIPNTFQVPMGKSDLFVRRFLGVVLGRTHFLITASPQQVVTVKYFWCVPCIIWSI